jgi:hypothetical protein
MADIVPNTFKSVCSVAVVLLWSIFKVVVSVRSVISSPQRRSHEFRWLKIVNLMRNRNILLSTTYVGPRPPRNLVGGRDLPDWEAGWGRLGPSILTPVSVLGPKEAPLVVPFIQFVPIWGQSKGSKLPCGGDTGGQGKVH